MASTAGAGWAVIGSMCMTECFSSRRRPCWRAALPGGWLRWRDGGSCRVVRHAVVLFDLRGPPLRQDLQVRQCLVGGEHLVERIQVAERAVPAPPGHPLGHA